MTLRPSGAQEPTTSSLLTAQLLSAHRWFQPPLWVWVCPAIHLLLAGPSQPDAAIPSLIYHVDQEVEGRLCGDNGGQHCGFGINGTLAPYGYVDSVSLGVTASPTKVLRVTIGPIGWVSPCVFCVPITVCTTSSRNPTRATHW